MTKNEYDMVKELKIKKGLNPINQKLVSDELYDKSIGKINKNPEMYSFEYRKCIIHLIDAVSRGYITPFEAYDAVEAKYFPEFLKIRRSAYQHLL